MDPELSEMLRVWGERGPALISAVLEERKRLLDLAALHRDDLSAQLFEAQNEITILREKAREQEKLHLSEQSQMSVTIDKLKATVSSLKKQVQEAKDGSEDVQAKLEQVTKERDKALRFIDEKERSAEDMLEALQKSLHSEAKAKSTARGSILNLQQENIQCTQQVLNHRLKAEKESRRADIAERQASELQKRLDKILTERSITSEDKPGACADPIKPSTDHSGANKNSTAATRSEVVGPTVEDVPSEVTQNDDNSCDRPRKKRLVRSSSEKEISKEPHQFAINGSNCLAGRLQSPTAPGKHSIPQKTHGPQKRKTRATPAMKSALLPCETKHSNSKSYSSRSIPSNHERPRRKRPKVSYVYPIHGDSDVQTRDRFCAPASITHK